MRRAIFMLITLSMLAACGTKGPLYLPEKKDKHPQAPETVDPLPSAPAPLQPPSIEPVHP